MSTLRILGIDPGLSNMGYAVADVDARSATITAVREVGISQAERQNLLGVRKTSDHLRRAMIQAKALRQIADAHGVAAVAMEMVTLTPYKHPTFSFGVMTGIVAGLGLPVIEVLPHEVKFAATGDKRGSKRDIVAWAIRKTGKRSLAWPTSARENAFRLTYRGQNVAKIAEHPADALAAVEAAVRTEQFRFAASLGH